MKPRNKRQYEVMSLSSKLPQITASELLWARKNIYKHTAFTTKQRSWCSDCGATFVSAGDAKYCECPACHARLKVERSRKEIVDDKAYFTKLCVIGDYQVIRHFYARRYIRRGCVQPYYKETEVVQIWLNSNGDKYIVARRQYTMSRYQDYNWALASPMELRRLYTSYYGYRSTAYCIWAPILPNGKVLPILRKHGYTSRCQSAAPDEIMTYVLTDNAMETLIKQRQYALLGYFIRRGMTQRYKHSINIATRNGYRIKDASLWCDYIDLLRRFDLDTHNAKYVCPARLKEAHNRLDKRKRDIEARERAEMQRRAQAAKLKSDAKAIEAYKGLYGKYFDIRLKLGMLKAYVLPDVEAFIQEGEAMSHCVFSNGYYKKKNCLILSVRGPSDKRVATVEFNLRTFKVEQCRGRCNSQPKEYDDILKMFAEGAGEIKRVNQSNAS